MSEGKKEAPAIGVSLQMTIDQKRTLVLQTHVPQEEASSLNGVLDTITKAADRQDAKYLVEHVRRLLRQAERNYMDTEAGIERQRDDARAAWEASGRQGEFTVGGTVAADVNNGLKSLVRFREEIAAHRDEIARLEAVAE